MYLCRIPPLLRRNIHCAAARDLSDENFMFALNAFMNESASSRNEIIQGLACRNDPASLDLYEVKNLLLFVGKTSLRIILSNS